MADRKAVLMGLLQGLLPAFKKRQQQKEQSNEFTQLQQLLNPQAQRSGPISDAELMEGNSAAPDADESLGMIQSALGGGQTTPYASSPQQSIQQPGAGLQNIDAKEMIKTVPTPQESLVKARMQTLESKDALERKELAETQQAIQRLSSSPQGATPMGKAILADKQKKQRDLLGRVEKNSREKFNLQEKYLKYQDERQKGETKCKQFESILKEKRKVIEKYGKDIFDESETQLLNDALVKGNLDVAGELIAQKAFEGKQQSIQCLLTLLLNS
jgi:hypothetical protein